MKALHWGNECLGTMNFNLKSHIHTTNMATEKTKPGTQLLLLHCSIIIYRGRYVPGCFLNHAWQALFPHPFSTALKYRMYALALQKSNHL